MNVLVTGASGFLGKAVCLQLTAGGHTVSALVRRPGSQPPGTHAVAGDMTDRASLARAVHESAPGCVIHLAAEIATQRDPAKIHAVNIDGTRALLEACAKLPTPPKFVFTSTVVTGDAHGAVLDEDTPLPVQTTYGRSKQDGEALVRESGLPWVIIRPSHVYGPGGWYAEEIVRRLRSPGRMVVIGRGENFWDVVHVDDVARACVLAAERAEPGSTFHVVDDEPQTQQSFVSLTAAALGVGAPRHVPVWLAQTVGGREPIAAVVRSAKSSNARIKRELGWSPAYPTARDGVSAAIAALDR